METIISIDTDNNNEVLSRARLIVHPVRSRILAALMGREQTPRQLSKLLPDIPLPTLYRNLAILTSAGHIVVSSEKQVRGVIEKTLALADGAATLTPEDRAELDPQEMLDNFLLMLSQSMRSYRSRGGEETPRCLADSVHLTPDSARALWKSLWDQVAETDQGGERHLIAIVLQPDETTTQPQEP